MRARSGASRKFSMMGILLVVAMVASGCLYYPAAQRQIAASGGTDVPWWCEGSPDLTPAECSAFSAVMDLALAYAQQYPSLAEFTATGAGQLPLAPDGVGFAYGEAATTFVASRPNVLLYDGTDPASRLVGYAWAVEGPVAPEGFDGARDVWMAVDPPGLVDAGEPVDTLWWLSAWMVRGYLNHPDVFAASHPCLESEVPLTSTADACFLASHTEPLQILVTNDDGVDAPGIDAMVEALLGVSGVDIEIVAPAENQSGSGDSYTPGGTTSAPATTASGRAAIAVDGTPADSVLHAIYALGLAPDLVMSGINEGQNLTSIGDLFSGTVGAARTGARSYVPAVASSQGTVAGLDPDFDSGADAALAWLERFRLGTAGPPFMTVANINIPTCAPGSSIRGTVETVVAPSVGPGQSYFTQDCTSTETEINDDLDAFNHGFIGIADMGLGL